MGGKGRPEEIKARIAQIEKEIEMATSDYDKEKAQERLAKLSGGVAVINVGAATEVEMKELVERAKDAVEATKAAVEEGILPGGGVALLVAMSKLDEVEKKLASDEEKVGVHIVRKALAAPLRRLAANAGADEGFVVNEILAAIKRGKTDWGYNVVTGQFGSMYEAGIIDPAKVTISALKNAISVAVMVLTTEAMVADIPEKEDKKAAPEAGPEY